MAFHYVVRAVASGEVLPDLPVLILFVLVAALIVVAVLQFLRIAKLEKKLQTFTKGRNVASLESEIVGLFKDNRHLVKNAGKNKKDIDDIRNKMASHISKVGIVKYDAFHQMGGQLSFALCMLDREDNGFILNSVQSADGCYTYIKEIIAGQSTIELGREEEQAFLKALETV